MSFQITSQQILQLNPRLANADELASGINSTAAKYSIDQSLRRLRYFVAQSFYETQQFTFWVENLNYTTPSRLVAVWPRRFTVTGEPGKSNANMYVNNPQGLANLVYANQYGNGDQQSGDGFKFRGRGASHLTFKSNYYAYSMSAYGDDRIVQNPDLVAQPSDAFKSAGWFWDIKKLNALADADSFTEVTKIINGSIATVPQRLPVLNRVNAVIV